MLSSLALHFGAVTTPQEAEDLRKVLQKITVNALPVVCSERATSKHSVDQHVTIPLNIGKVLALHAAMFNHSCKPNCHLSFVGNPFSCSHRVAVRTLQPILQGEPLTVCYGDMLASKNHSTPDRRRLLRAHYGFHCVCTACEMKEELVSAEDQQHYIKAADYYQKGKRLIREQSYREAVEVLSRSSAPSRKSRHLRQRMMPHRSTKQNLRRTCTNNQRTTRSKR